MEGEEKSDWKMQKGQEKKVLEVDMSRNKWENNERVEGRSSNPGDQWGSKKRKIGD